MKEMIYMKRIIIDIEKCSDCPNLVWLGKYSCDCIKQDTGEIKIIEDQEQLPDWCPLEDYKELI
jgi:hypothetical protein